MMDQDGHNIRYLSDGRNIVVTPRFSPDGRDITYTEISSGVQVILKHLVTGQQVLETARGLRLSRPGSPRTGGGSSTRWR